MAEKVSKVWKGEAGLGLLSKYSRQRLKAANEFVQRQTISNQILMEERDPAVR